MERRELTLTNTTATYRANDLYDPTYTMGGHQPRGFDELMAVYGETVRLKKSVPVKNM